MNFRIIVIIIAVLILGGTAFWFINQSTQNAVSLNPSVLPTNIHPSGNVPVTSNDKRVTFQYPESWFLTQNNSGEQGEFGTILESWTVTSYNPEHTGDSMSEDSAKIDIEIQDGGQNLSIEKLVDCDGKTLTCEKIGINSEQFIKSTAVLNTGMTHIVVATFYDDKILRASAFIQPGEEKDELTRTAEKVFNSFMFIN